MAQPIDSISLSQADTAALVARLADVHGQIAATAAAAGRSPDEITLVAVSKTKPFAQIQAALDAGQVDFGENRLEELWQKVETAQAQGVSGIRWHMIGTIQSRKTNLAIGPFALIHSVDRLKIARRLHLEAQSQERVLDVLLEVNVSGEESKHGFTPASLLADMPALLQYGNLRLCGLMTMAPLVADPEAARPCFRALRLLLQQLRQDFPTAQHAHATWQHLSMGMTNDYKQAIEEGTTILRIGSAIFGTRE